MDRKENQQDTRHSGIKGNDVVDTLAKSATATGYDLTTNIVPSTDLISKFTSYLKQLWQQEYNSSVTGLNYVGLQNNIPSKSWFHGLTKRNFIVTINRIRSNHAMTPLYKYKIGLDENPYCLCGEVGDMNHVILEC
uniref:Uncharacterized protein LOC114341057 n=1 Tax=Diabrotica virgifera virgifera TaxID=50390 RepID=A0A6P7GNR1_DIAVI